MEQDFHPSFTKQIIKNEIHAAEVDAMAADPGEDFFDHRAFDASHHRTDHGVYRGTPQPSIAFEQHGFRSASGGGVCGADSGGAAADDDDIIIHNDFAPVVPFVFFWFPTHSIPEKIDLKIQKKAVYLYKIALYRNIMINYSAIDPDFPEKSFWPDSGRWRRGTVFT